MTLTSYRNYLVVTAVLAFLLLHSDYLFADIWEVTFANDVNDNGTVVGSSDEFTFTWTLADGMQVIPPLDPDGIFCNDGGSAISADGATAVGSFFCEAFRWTIADGTQGIGFLPGGVISTARDVSADGNIIVGWGWEGIFDEHGDLVDFGENEAFRWTSSEGMQGLGFLPGGSVSRAFEISSDGSTIVGYARDASVFYKPVRWTDNGEIEQLDIPASSLGGFATGVSADGSVVVGGDIRNEDGTEGIALRWTVDGSFQSLGVLPGETTSGVSGVSANGSVIVGGSGMKPIIYTEAAGMRLLEDVLTEQGIDLSDWEELLWIGNISPNGRYIVGGGRPNDDEYAGFVAKLALWGDVNQDDEVNLLDIAPFVDLLVKMEFLYEADVNQDGVVDLLDIRPFVALLTEN